MFDAVRPITPQLWARLPAGEQLRLLQRHALWSVHRHRMAPEVADKVARLRSAGRLDVIAGQLISIAARFGLPRVHFRRRWATKREVIRPALILNCRGTDYDLRSDTFLATLVKRSIVLPSPNFLGLVPGQQGEVVSILPDRLFAIGAPLFGSVFETTAVPELRVQARNIADSIAALTISHGASAAE